MNLFGNIFKSSSEEEQDNLWKTITSEKDIEDAVKLSFERKVVIFKHSTRCGVSRMVLKKFENEMALKKDEVIFFYLDLLRYRDLSHKIAEDFGVTHQSPQMIVLEKGIAVKDASHNEISVMVI